MPKKNIQVSFEWQMSKNKKTTSSAEFSIDSDGDVVKKSDYYSRFPIYIQ